MRPWVFVFFVQEFQRGSKPAATGLALAVKQRKSKHEPGLPHCMLNRVSVMDLKDFVTGTTRHCRKSYSHATSSRVSLTDLQHHQYAGHFFLPSPQRFGFCCKYLSFTVLQIRSRCTSLWQRWTQDTSGPGRWVEWNNSRMNNLTVTKGFRLPIFRPELPQLSHTFCLTRAHS